MCYINAILLSRYIEHLMAEDSNSTYVDTDIMYPTASKRDSHFVRFDLIGHSNGGLVSRYYVENLGGDRYVDKLITIDTPHYGSSMAQLGLSSRIFASVIFCPMNVDLASDSQLFTGNHMEFVDGNIFGSLNYIGNKSLQYALSYQSPQLNGNNTVSTKYYAIGGIDYDNPFCSNNIYSITFERTITSVYNFITLLQGAAQSQCGTSLQYLSDESSDNVIDITTQFGLKKDPNDSNHFSDYIRFYYTTLIVYDGPAWNYSISKSWHVAIKSEIVTHTAILSFLNG